MRNALRANALALSLAAGSIAGAEQPAPLSIRDVRADFGRPDLVPPSGTMQMRALGGVDATIGNPNPWAGLIGPLDYFDGFESYIPHTALSPSTSWLELAGQVSPLGFVWSSASDYNGVVNNAIAQTGPNWNPGGVDFDRHGVTGGPDPGGDRSQFFATPRGTIEPQAMLDGNFFVARVSHPLMTPTTERPLTILCDFYLDDISTFTWFRPTSFTEGFVVTSVFMGGYDFVYFEPFVNEDSVADRLIALWPSGSLENHFFGAADPHRIAEREWFTIAIRITNDGASLWVRDSTTIGVNGFEQDSIYDGFPGDAARGAFAGEIFVQDWLQVVPGVDDDPATASVEGNGPAFNEFNQEAFQFLDSTGSPASWRLFAGTVDAFQLIGGADPDESVIFDFQPHDWYADNYTVLGTELSFGDPPSFCLPFLEDLESYAPVSLGLLGDQWSATDPTAAITSEQNATPGGAQSIEHILFNANGVFREVFARDTPPAIANQVQPAEFSVQTLRPDTAAGRAIIARDSLLTGQDAATILMGARAPGGSDDRVYARVANPNFDPGQPESQLEGPTDLHTNGVNARFINVPLFDDQGQPLTTPVGQWFEVRAALDGDFGDATLRIFIDGAEGFPDGSVEGVAALTAPTVGFDALEFWVDAVPAGLLSAIYFDDIAVTAEPDPATDPTPATIDGPPYIGHPPFALPYDDNLGSYSVNQPLGGQGATPWLSALFSGPDLRLDIAPLAPGTAVDGSTLGYSYTIIDIDGTPPPGVAPGATVFVVDNIAPPYPFSADPRPGAVGQPSPVQFVDPLVSCGERATGSWRLLHSLPQPWNGATPVVGRFNFRYGTRWSSLAGAERLVAGEIREGQFPWVELTSPFVSGLATTGGLNTGLFGRLPIAQPARNERAVLTFDLWVAIDDPAAGPRGRLAWDVLAPYTNGGLFTRMVFGGPNNFVDENTFIPLTGAVTPGPDGFPDDYHRSESQSDPRRLYVLRDNPNHVVGAPLDILQPAAWHVPGNTWIRCTIEVKPTGDWIATFDDGATPFVVTGSALASQGITTPAIDALHLRLGLDPGADGVPAPQPITWTSLGAAAAPEGGAAPLPPGAGDNQNGSYNSTVNPVYFYFEIFDFWPGATNLPDVSEVDPLSGAVIGTRPLEQGDIVALWNDQSTASIGGAAGTRFLNQIATNPTFKYSADGGATVSARGDWIPLGLPGDDGISDPAPLGGIVNNSPAYNSDFPFVEILMGSIAAFPPAGPSHPAAQWRIDNIALSIEGCLGDLSGDGAINGADLGLLLGAWGTTNSEANLNGDAFGQVNGSDLGILLGAWGVCP